MTLVDHIIDPDIKKARNILIRVTNSLDNILKLDLTKRFQKQQFLKGSSFKKFSTGTLL